MKKMLFLMIAFVIVTFSGSCEKDSVTVKVNVSGLTPGSEISLALVCENRPEAVFFFTNVKSGVNTLVLTGADARLAIASGDPCISVDVTKTVNRQTIYIDKCFIDLPKITPGVNQASYSLK